MIKNFKKKGPLKIFKKEKTFNSLSCVTVFVRLLYNTLCYFKDSEDAYILGRLELQPSEVEITLQSKGDLIPKQYAASAFIIQPKGLTSFKKMIFAAENIEESQQWIEALQSAQKCNIESVNLQCCDYNYPPAGYLEKRKPHARWRKRFFILESEKKTLAFFSDIDSKTYKGGIYIPKVISILESTETDNAFIISTKNRKLVLKAPSSESQKSWIKALSGLLRLQFNNNTVSSTPPSPLDSQDAVKWIITKNESEIVIKSYLKLLSRSSKNKAWKRKFYWIRNSTIFWSPDLTNSASSIKTIEMDDFKCVYKDDKEKWSFQLICNMRKYYLSAFSESDYNDWISVLTTLKQKMQKPTPLNLSNTTLIVHTGRKPEPENHHDDLNLLISKNQLVEMDASIDTDQYIPYTYNITLYFPVLNVVPNLKRNSKVIVPIVNSMTINDLLTTGLLLLTQQFFNNDTSDYDREEKLISIITGGMKINDDQFNTWLQYTFFRFSEMRAIDRSVKFLIYRGFFGKTLMEWCTTYMGWSFQTSMAFGTLLFLKKYIRSFNKDKYECTNEWYICNEDRLHELKTKYNNPMVNINEAEFQYLIITPKPEIEIVDINSFYLRVPVSKIIVSNLDQKLSSLNYIREQLDQSLGIRFLVEEHLNVSEDKELDIPKDNIIIPNNILDEYCYNILEINHIFEMYINHIAGKICRR